VTELNASDGTPVRILTGADYGFSRPYAIAADRTHVWVLNTNGNSVTELVLAGVGYGFAGPWGMAVDGSHIWVTNSGGGSVTELSAR
jgi:DNA-binding beta-propeller fold protein YncE